MLGVIVCCIIIVGIICVLVWYYPSVFLYPINRMFLTDMSYRTNIYTEDERDRIFPIGKELENIWKTIRDEGYELYNLLPNKDINYLENYHIDLGKEDKKHWTTIPLRLFGRNTTYIDKCKNLKKILEEHTEIKSCLFSIMEPGKIILPHYGPYDGLIRYQLALDIPKITNEEEECYLHVDNIKYQWIEGTGVLFDENRIHGAVNTTSKKRMVLLIDIERPYSLTVFQKLNKIIIYTIGQISQSKQYELI